MAEMTPRERMRAALEHREPDRVPTALGGGPYSLTDDVYLRLVPLLGLGDPVAPFRTGHNVSYMDDRVLDRLGTDARYVWPTLSPSDSTPLDGEAFVDGYGQRWKRAFPYFYPDTGMLADVADIDGIDELVTWPDPADPRWTSGVRERARLLHEETDCFVVARMVTSHGPYQTASDLRGAGQFLFDMKADPAFTGALVDRVTDSLVGLLRGYLEAGGRYLDMIELPGDDYATNTGMAMSPAMFRLYFKPAIHRMVEVVKTFRPDLKVMFHCDGALTSILGDLADAGVDVVHPIEPLPAMVLPAIKAEFGERLSFLGGIDIKDALPGDREEVVDEVRLRIGQLAPGGGYVLAPANHVQPDVPAENVVTLFEAARDLGRYPIRTR
jgi:uroporphyrinogen decarboxylase